MYRIKDVEAIREVMPELSDKIQETKLQILSPTIREINSVNSIIYDYIIKNKRIVYGGFAQNKLIEIKNKNDVFYTPLDTPDIEFYSPNPIEDLINLSQILFEKGFPRVSGQEGVHNETYKLFVNFEDYCDISYMPKNIYNEIPFMVVEGMRITDPLFMLIDSFRVYADPLTSWWRIEKSFKRTELLLKYYPLPENKNNEKIRFSEKPSNEINDCLRFIRKKILHKLNSLVVFGFYAYNYFIKKSKLKDLLVITPFYDIISTNYEDDIKIIYNILKKKFPMT